jgi:hypothetical protein
LPALRIFSEAVPVEDGPVRHSSIERHRILFRIELARATFSCLAPNCQKCRPDPDFLYSYSPAAAVS